VAARRYGHAVLPVTRPFGDTIVSPAAKI